MEEQEKYQSINHRINQSVRYYRVPSSVEKGAALNLLLKKIENTPASKSLVILIRPYLKYAAIFIAAAFILSVYFFWPDANQNVVNNTSQSITIRLPDQSRVVVASGSKVSYKKQFGNNTIFLNGEGYFEVIPGRTFKVKTASGEVHVLGTRFSVYEYDNTLSVDCFEGTVKISREGVEHLLHKGNGIVFTDEGTQNHDLSEVNYPSFARFKASYIETTLQNVLKDLEEFFDITIHSQYNGIRYYSGSFETGSLENALILICEPLGLKYTIEDAGKVIIN